MPGLSLVGQEKLNEDGQQESGEYSQQESDKDS
jgi:hypothetical protein